MIHFQAHGQNQIKIVDNIMMIESAGPWNHEFFLELHKELLAASKNIDVNNYAVLLSLSGEAVTSLKNIDFHTNFIKQGHTKAVAVNLANCTSSPITKSLFSSAYQKAGLTHAFFNDKEAAIEWLSGFIRK